ncbi:Protein of unknown function [Cotesia congregata]|uniref:Uncharacterized protein n=1 Tax=Cotesia congregata TaxID=51543 RepID=A0A8J2H4U3_COTCN|nr:Protein of unknown function [Cotesia congregata]
MTEDNQQKYALVCWIGGKFDQNYTLDIPTEWIRDFILEEWEQNFNDTAYLIEWREKISKKRKKQLGGWPVYDGYVIAVSCKL